MCERYNVGRRTKFLNLRLQEVTSGESSSARGQGGEEVAEEEAAYQVTLGFVTGAKCDND